MSKTQNFSLKPTQVRNVFEIELPSVLDDRGHLTFFETQWLSAITKLTKQKIKRFFIVDKVPIRTARGNHAHENGWQMILCVHGCASISVDDGKKDGWFSLYRPNMALLVGPMVWIEYEVENWDSVVLVVCSENYDEEICIKDREKFDRLVASL